MLKDVFCVADGLKLYLEQSGSYFVQNMFYIGWTQDHYVTDVLLFASKQCGHSVHYKCTKSYA